MPIDADILEACPKRGRDSVRLRTDDLMAQSNRQRAPQLK